MWFRLRTVNKVFCLNLLIQCPFHLTRKPRRKWLKWTCISCLFTRDLTLILLLVSSALSPCIPLVKPPEPPHKSLTYFTSPAPLQEVWKSLDYGAGASKEIWDQVLTRSHWSTESHANDHICFQHCTPLTLVYKYANYQAESMESVLSGRNTLKLHAWSCESLVVKFWSFSTSIRRKSADDTHTHALPVRCSVRWKQLTL